MSLCTTYLTNRRTGPAVEPGGGGGDPVFAPVLCHPADCSRGGQGGLIAVIRVMLRNSPVASSTAGSGKCQWFGLLHMACWRAVDSCRSSSPVVIGQLTHQSSTGVIGGELGGAFLKCMLFMLSMWAFGSTWLALPSGHPQYLAQL